MAGAQKDVSKSSCSLIVWKKKAASQQIGCVMDAFLGERGHDHHLEFVKGNEQF